MPIISICILLEFIKFLKEQNPRLLGLILFILVILMSSFGTITSPLVMFSHYRIVQGASPGSDIDYIVASQIVSLLSASSEGYTIIYDASWPYNTLNTVNIILKFQQLRNKLPEILVNHSTKLKTNENIIYNGWKVFLIFKAEKNRI